MAPRAKKNAIASARDVALGRGQRDLSDLRDVARSEPLHVAQHEDFAEPVGELRQDPVEDSQGVAGLNGGGGCLASRQRPEGEPSAPPPPRAQGLARLAQGGADEIAPEPPGLLEPPGEAIEGQEHLLEEIIESFVGAEAAAQGPPDLPRVTLPHGAHRPFIPLRHPAHELRIAHPLVREWMNHGGRRASGRHGHHEVVAARGAGGSRNVRSIPRIMTGPASKDRSAPGARRGGCLGAAVLFLATSCGSTDLLASERLPVQEPEEPTPTLRVEGTRLLDRCGDELLLRGANEMVVWSGDQDGDPELFELAKTGANAVRIVWLSTEPAEALDRALDVARRAGLVPVVELHDGQGDFNQLDALVAFWTAPETVAVLEKHERALLVEIGGGLGGDVPGDLWEEGYRYALRALRDAGIRVPLVIHAPDWGNDAARLVASAPALLDADPGKNLLFAFSAWQLDVPSIVAHLDELRALGIATLIAEFSGYFVDDCPMRPFDYASFLEASARDRVGWFAWSWGGVPNAGCEGALDMTADGTLEGLHAWGLDVALAHPFGISRTSSPVRSGCGAEIDATSSMR